MNRRLVKEFRSLLLPWSIAVIAGSVLAIKLMVDPSAVESFDAASGSWNVSDPFESILAGTAASAFFGMLVIACALSFGSELQQRTLSLLLAQPVPRLRLWNEKLLVLAGAVLAAVLIHCLVQLLTLAWVPFVQPHLDLTPQQLLLAGSFLLATVCSAGFWTLLSRSTIGGMAFCLSSQFLLGSGAAFLAQKLHEWYAPRFGGFTPAYAIITGWLIYSALLLWLGWRKFARLEIKGISLEGGWALSPSKPGSGLKWWCAWLRCRPTGGLLNLFRKELRLQRPVFQVAAVFTVCWLAALALLMLQPAHQSHFEIIFNVLTVFYAPLAMLLAGCVSLGEEKSLGLITWHLTLPISARRQWLIKLGVAAGVGVGLGWALPYLLARLTAAKVHVGLFTLTHWSDDSSLRIILLVLALAFVMSFWAATFPASTVRAVLVSVIGLVALFVCGRLGAWCGGNLGGLETSLLTSITAHFQLVPTFFANALRTAPVGVVLVALMLVALIQSHAQFRRSQVQNAVIVRCSSTLAALAFLGMLWFADFSVSASNQLGSRLVWEVHHALQALPAEDGLAPWPHSRDVTAQELAKTGELSRTSRIWLRDAWITLNPSPNGRIVIAPYGTATNKAMRVICPATLHFPNGTYFSFSYEVPRPVLNKHQ